MHRNIAVISYTKRSRSATRPGSAKEPRVMKGDTFGIVVMLIAPLFICAIAWTVATF
jgi:hypothetical protein